MEVTARSSGSLRPAKDCGHYGGCFSAVYKRKKWRWLPPKTASEEWGGSSVIPGQPEYE